MEHFYLYNNLSTDRYQEILKPYIEMGVVDLFEWPIETKNQREYLEQLQLPAYNHALAITKEVAEWAAFIDLDEFLLPMRHDNLIQMLSEYTSFGGIAINWQLFGTSGIDKLPQGGLIIEHLIYKAPEQAAMNEYVKLIVQPRHVAFIGNPHSFQFNEGYFAVNSNGVPLPPKHMMQPVIIDTVCINHYWCGTLEWLLQNKLPRRKKWGWVVTPEYLDYMCTFYNEVQDEKITVYVNPLKTAMGVQ